MALKVICLQVLRTMEISPEWCNPSGFVHSGRDLLKHLVAYILFYKHVLNSAGAFSLLKTRTHLSVRMD